jgi:hypothetical protein
VKTLKENKKDNKEQVLTLIEYQSLNWMLVNQMEEDYHQPQSYYNRTISNILILFFLISLQVGSLTKIQPPEIQLVQLETWISLKITV